MEIILIINVRLVANNVLLAIVSKTGAKLVDIQAILKEIQFFISF